MVKIWDTIMMAGILEKNVLMTGSESNFEIKNGHWNDLITFWICIVFAGY